MGFDLSIIINTGIDQFSGLAFGRDENLEILPFNPLEYQIPIRFLKFIHQNGYHFHHYIQNFDQMTTQCEAEIFLHYYPEWDTVFNEISNEDYEWKKDDHDRFKECLKWLTSKHVFGIRWSY